MSANPTEVFNDWERICKESPYAVYVAEIPEDSALGYDEYGTMKPFVVLYFGGPIPSASDRGIVSAKYDTTILHLTVECYAARSGDSRAIKGYFIDKLLGHTSVDDEGTTLASELSFLASGQYTRASNAVRPTQYIDAVAFECRSNLSQECVI